MDPLPLRLTGKPGRASAHQIVASDALETRDAPPMKNWFERILDLKDRMSDMVSRLWPGEVEEGGERRGDGRGDMEPQPGTPGLRPGAPGSWFRRSAEHSKACASGMPDRERS